MVVRHAPPGSSATSGACARRRPRREITVSGRPDGRTDGRTDATRFYSRSPGLFYALLQLPTNGSPAPSSARLSARVHPIARAPPSVRVRTVFHREIKSLRMPTNAGHPFVRSSVAIGLSISPVDGASPNERTAEIESIWPEGALSVGAPRRQRRDNAGGVTPPDLLCSQFARRPSSLHTGGGGLGGQGPDDRK